MFCFCSIFCKQKHFHVSDFDLWKEHNKRNKKIIPKTKDYLSILLTKMNSMEVLLNSSKIYFAFLENMETELLLPSFVVQSSGMR